MASSKAKGRKAATGSSKRRKRKFRAAAATTVGTADSIKGTKQNATLQDSAQFAETGDGNDDDNGDNDNSREKEEDDDDANENQVKGHHKEEEEEAGPIKPTDRPSKRQKINATKTEGNRKNKKGLLKSTEKESENASMTRIERTAKHNDSVLDDTDEPEEKDQDSSDNDSDENDSGKVEQEGNDGIDPENQHHEKEEDEEADDDDDDDFLSTFSRHQRKKAHAPTLLRNPKRRHDDAGHGSNGDGDGDSKKEPPLFVSAETYRCAIGKLCVACAYKIACFDVALDTSFTSEVPNKRPELCPRMQVLLETEAAAALHPKSKAVVGPSKRAIRKVQQAEEGKIWSTTMIGNNHYNQKDEKEQGKYDSLLKNRDENDHDENTTNAPKKAESKKVNAATATLSPYVSLPAEPTNTTAATSLGFQRGMKILTVGDGDLSFSLALARMLLSPMKTTTTHLVATTHESLETLRSVYDSKILDSTLQELSALGVTVCHNVDATRLQETLPKDALKQTATPADQDGKKGQAQDKGAKLKFHRIVWNFPCSAVPNGQDGQNSEMQENHRLVRSFVASATPLLSRPDGEIQMAHKSKPPFGQWRMDVVALSSSSDEGPPLECRGRLVLDRALLYPYTPRKALDKKSFPCHDARTYVFGWKWTTHNGEEEERSNQEQVATNTDVVHFPPTVPCNKGEEQDKDDEPQNVPRLETCGVLPVTPDMIQSIRRIHLRTATTMALHAQNAKRKKGRKRSPRGDAAEKGGGAESKHSPAFSRKRGRQSVDRGGGRNVAGKGQKKQRRSR